MQRRELLVQALWGSAACLTAGCGTIFHKERINRPHSRDIDWSVVALNGLGLLFFFVPGVIAFAVDFHTGAIYLPPEGPVYSSYPAVPAAEYALPVPAEPHTTFSPPKVFEAGSMIESRGDAHSEAVPLRMVAIGRDRLDAAAIEARLSEHLGRPVRLDAESTRVSPMERLADYSDRRRQHDADPAFGTSLRRFFQRLRPA